MDIETSVASPPPPVPLLGTVLCAVDSSAAAGNVLYTAAGLAAERGSRLIVLRATNVLRRSDDWLAAQLSLDAFVRSNIPGWMAYREETELQVAAGAPAATILDVAAGRGANLIVVGTHGRGAVGRIALGSVAADVLQAAAVPVAIVPPSGCEVIALTDTSAVPHVGTVLVPVDLRARSARQLAFASMVATAAGRGVVVLHALPAHADKEESLERLRHVAASIDSANGVVSVVAHGAVVDVILDRQRRSGAGIIVLGRDATAPGRVALALLQRTRSLVISVP
jgi:nucleotide-binding universal stress UspA family protein